jgi:hypothetical protein
MSSFWRSQNLRISSLPGAPFMQLHRMSGKTNRFTERNTMNALQEAPAGRAPHLRGARDLPGGRLLALPLGRPGSRFLRLRAERNLRRPPMQAPLHPAPRRLPQPRLRLLRTAFHPSRRHRKRVLPARHRAIHRVALELNPPPTTCAQQKRPGRPPGLSRKSRFSPRTGPIWVQPTETVPLSLAR